MKVLVFAAAGLFIAFAVLLGIAVKAGSSAAQCGDIAGPDDDAEDGEEEEDDEEED